MRVKLLLLVLVFIAFARVYVFCDHEFYMCSQRRIERPAQTPAGERLEKFRLSIVRGVREVMPSPQSELVLGMVLGFDGIKSTRRFNDVLISTGTIHVVVVSGYNISLVMNLISKSIRSRSKLFNIITAQIFAVIYAVITGFGDPVVRALVMASIFSWGKYLGRLPEVMGVLVFSALALISIHPMYLFSISFQLSFLATLSLVMFSSLFPQSDNPILADFFTTIGAQFLVLPLISYYFGRVSLSGFIVNPLVLWTVTLITILGFGLIFLIPVSLLLTKFITFLLMPFLDFFINVTFFFSSFDFGVLDAKISIQVLIMYYLVLFMSYYVIIRRKSRA